jgi:hypothetical protein
MPKYKANLSKHSQSPGHHETSDQDLSGGTSEKFSDSHSVTEKDEIISERHYTFSPLETVGKKIFRIRPPTKIPDDWKRENDLIKEERSDQKTKDDVRQMLYRSSLVDASEVEIDVKNHILILRGFVKNLSDKELVASIVEHIPGIREVKNDIFIKSI